MPPERIQKVSDNELIVSKQKGFPAFKYLDMLIITGVCVFYACMFFHPAAEDIDAGSFVLFKVVIGIGTVYALYSRVIKPYFVVDTTKRIVKEECRLCINNEWYAINEHSGIYFRFESTFPGRGSGYYVVGLRLRAPSKIKNIPLLTCPK